MQGGFIGVDVFFVLSGFLITSLLLDELDAPAASTCTASGCRRARRLLPALVRDGAGRGGRAELFPPDAVDPAARRRRRRVLLGGELGVRRPADRLLHRRAAPPSPLQHTWSLGVEEQYYLVWPLLLIAVALLLAVLARRRDGCHANTVHRAVLRARRRGRGRRPRRRPSSWCPTATLNRVYFGTDTRAQALLVGAAAAALLVRDWPALTARLVP